MKRTLCALISALAFQAHANPQVLICDPAAQPPEALYTPALGLAHTKPRVLIVNMPMRAIALDTAAGGARAGRVVEFDRGTILAQIEYGREIAIEPLAGEEGGFAATHEIVAFSLVNGVIESHYANPAQGDQTRPAFAGVCKFAEDESEAK